MIALVVIFILMLLLKTSVFFPFADPEKGTSIALGFILIFAFLFGKQVNRLKLPQITGFILAGILCGPYVLKFLNANQVRDLQLLDGLALSLNSRKACKERKESAAQKTKKQKSQNDTVQDFHNQ